MKLCSGASLVVQWLRLHVPNARSLGLIPGQGTRSHMLQLRAHMLQLKILHASTKTQHIQTKLFKEYVIKSYAHTSV